MTQEAIREHQMAKTGGTTTDLFQCSKCKKKNCTYNQVWERGLRGRRQRARGSFGRSRGEGVRGENGLKLPGAERRPSLAPPPCCPRGF